MVLDSFDISDSNYRRGRGGNWLARIFAATAGAKIPVHGCNNDNSFDLDFLASDTVGFTKQQTLRRQYMGIYADVYQLVLYWCSNI